MDVANIWMKRIAVKVIFRSIITGFLLLGHEWSAVLDVRLSKKSTNTKISALNLFD